MKLGKANYNGSSSKKRFKIADGDNVYRILPPMGSLADQGRYSKYYSVVWGYKNSKGENRPFSDCRVTNYRTKMVEVESAAFVKSAKLKAMLATLKEKEKAGEKVDPNMMKKAEEMVQVFNIEGKHYVNAVNLQGEIGLLKLGAKAKQLLEEEMKKLIAKGVDPLSVDNGRYFNIFRSGRSFNTVYQVTQFKEQRTIEGGEVAEFPKIHKMDESFIKRLASEAFDLGTLYVSPTPEQVDAIVSGADPDTVLGKSENNPTEQEESVEDSSVADDLAKLAVEAKVNRAVQEVSSKLAEEAKLAAQAAVEDQNEDMTTASGTGQTNMSDEEFLRSMGL
jgi:hypothetical protein